MIYTVNAVADDFTDFHRKKYFWFYHNAYSFAERKLPIFDLVWIDKFGKCFIILKG